MQADRTDPRIADLVRTGRVRAALFPSFLYRKNAATGELQGLGIELTRALAESLGVAAEPIEYPTPPEAVRGLVTGACDVAFFGIDPGRGADMDFSPPYLQADFTFLVPAGSAIGSIADADQPGLRVAVVRHHAMDIALRGKLKHAAPVYAESPDAAFDLLRSGDVEVLAGIRPGLLRYADALPGARVLESRYGANVLAIAVAKGFAGRLAYVGEFIEQAKASGLLHRTIAKAGLRGVEVAARVE